jgi:electron transfer flavoprotein beta subunit
MKIITTVKRVTDYEARIKITPDNKFVNLTDVNMITNPFDEIGVEASLQIKNKLGGEIVVLSIGQQDSQQNIRSALAMGADRGILIKDFPLEHFMNTRYIACIMHQVIKDENPDIIIMGKQSIDTDNHQVSEYLSEKMGIGNASQANTISIEDNCAIVKKEADGGLETVKLSLPCIISTDLRLNQPRYPSLPGIMKAKRKPLKIVSVKDLDIDNENVDIEILNLKEQESKQAGMLLKNVDELLNHLKLKK